MRALIVDDCIELRYLLSILLNIEGYVVETAENGQEALQKILRSDIKFDLLITDYNMPIMNGKELIELLLKNKIIFNKIIILSANELNETNLQSILRKNENIKFLHKMTSTEEIIKVISL